MLRRAMLAKRLALAFGLMVVWPEKKTVCDEPSTAAPTRRETPSLLPFPATVRLGNSTKRPAERRLGAGRVIALGYSQDSKVLIALDEKKRQLAAWDTSTGKLLWRRILAGTTSCLAINLRDNALAVQDTHGGKDHPPFRFISFQNIWTGELVSEFVAHHDMITNLAFTEDGKALVTAGLDGKIRGWDISSRTARFAVLVDKDDSVYRALPSTDGSTIALLTSNEGLTIRDTTTGEIIAEPATRGLAKVTQVFKVNHGFVFVWMWTRERTAKDPPGTPARLLTINFWDTRPRKLVKSLMLSGVSGDGVAAISPDGALFAIVDNLPFEDRKLGESTIRVFDLESSRHIVDLYGHDDDVSTLAFSPDGKQLASGSADSTIFLWDVKAVRFEGLWRRLGSRSINEVDEASALLLVRPGENVTKICHRIAQMIEAADKLRPIVDMLESSKFVERESATAKLIAELPRAETALRILQKNSSSPESHRRLDRILPSLEPVEKPLPGGHDLDPATRRYVLELRYGKEIWNYPDSPNAAEFRGLMRVFDVLAQMKSAEARQFLESLAKRPDGDWFALRAKDALKKIGK